MLSIPFPLFLWNAEVVTQKLLNALVVVAIRVPLAVQIEQMTAASVLVEPIWLRTKEVATNSVRKITPKMGNISDLRRISMSDLALKSRI